MAASSQDQLRQIPSWILREGRDEELPRPPQQCQLVPTRHQPRQTVDSRLRADSHQVCRSEGKAPVIDISRAGYFKVLGKGVLPKQPVIVRPDSSPVWPRRDQGCGRSMYPYCAVDACQTLVEI